MMEVPDGFCVGATRKTGGEHMAMREAARAPSDCIKTRDLPGSRPGLRSARPLYCSLPRRLPTLVRSGAASFPASGRNPRNLSRRCCNPVGFDPDLPALGLHRPSGLYRRWWSRPGAGQPAAGRLAGSSDGDGRGDRVLAQVGVLQGAALPGEDVI